MRCEREEEEEPASSAKKGAQGLLHTHARVGFSSLLLGRKARGERQDGQVGDRWERASPLDRWETKERSTYLDMQSSLLGHLALLLEKFAMAFLPGGRMRSLSSLVPKQ